MSPRFYTSFSYALCTLSLLAAAVPQFGIPATTVTVTAPVPTVTGVNGCNTGSIECCSQVVASNSQTASLLLGLLSISLVGNPDLLGLECSPIPIAGVASGTACTVAPVCCTTSLAGGFLYAGCTHIVL